MDHTLCHRTRRRSADPHHSKTRRAGFTLAAMLLGFVSLAACSAGSGSSSDSGSGSASHTPVSVPAWNPPVTASTEVANASTPQIVAYGPDPAQTMEVFQSSGDPMGTIIYIHGGGWSGGSAQDNTNAAILSQEQQVRAAELARLDELAAGASKQTLERVKRQLARGWDIVSIDYRLATGSEAPGVAATRIIGDVDRAIRYSVAEAGPLQLDMRKLVLSGASAGGHLTLMEALTANTATYLDPTLPPALRSIELHFDGIVPFVAPTDIASFATAGGLAPSAEAALLGCTTLPASQALAGTPRCDGLRLAESLSPITLTRAAATAGVELMPAYFGYGGADQLVPVATQGTPEVQAWAAAAGPGQTWFDFPPEGTHNLEDTINQVALADWLDNVESGRWTGSSTLRPSS